MREYKRKVGPLAGPGGASAICRSVKLPLAGRAQMLSIGLGAQNVRQDRWRIQAVRWASGDEPNGGPGHTPRGRPGK